MTCLLLSCSSGEITKKEEKVKKVPAQPKIEYKSIARFTSASSKCRSDFYYYIPSDQNDQQKLITAICFDPQGNGKLPVEKYKNMADDMSIILIGSNQLKNGLDYSVVQSTFNCLYNTILQSLPVDSSQILFVGFSGGGRIALKAGSQIPNTKGVISCGAGQAPSSFNKGTSYVFAAGNEDFNYMECREVVSKFPEGYKLLFVPFNGKHEWPDTLAMSQAIQYCLSPSPRKDYAYTKEETKIFAAEAKERKNMQENYVRKDINWWNNYIDQLSAKASKNDSPEALSYKRSLSFLSMFSYMYTESAINMQNISNIEYSLAIYEKVDPDNPDMHFFNACYFAMMQNNEQAIKEVEEAIKQGFTSKEKLETSPFLQNLRTDNRFLDMLSKL